MNDLNMNGIWKLQDPRYKIMELKGDALQQEIAKMSRYEILEWLQWNDRNGIYTDKESMREFGNVASREEAVEIMTRQIEEA